MQLNLSIVIFTFVVMVTMASNVVGTPTPCMAVAGKKRQVCVEPLLSALEDTHLCFLRSSNSVNTGKRDVHSM